MNDNQKQLEEWSKLDCDATEFDELENKLNTQLEEQLSDLESLELDSEKIGNPDSIGETVSNVVWSNSSTKLVLLQVRTLSVRIEA